MSSDAQEILTPLENFLAFTRYLHFRIALLRTEEQKALGKINETQARAKEILNNKRRNESHLQERFSVALQVCTELSSITARLSQH